MLQLLSTVVGAERSCDVWSSFRARGCLLGARPCQFFRASPLSVGERTLGVSEVISSFGSTVSEPGQKKTPGTQGDVGPLPKKQSADDNCLQQGKPWWEDPAGVWALCGGR